MKFKINKKDDIESLVKSFHEKIKSGEVMPFYDSDDVRKRKQIGKIIGISVIDGVVEFEAEITDKRFIRGRLA